MKTKSKKLLSLLLAVVMTLGLLPAIPLTAEAASGDVEINTTNFPDANFRAYVATFDKNNNGILSKSERNSVYQISCSGKGITSLEGIKHFPNITALYCNSNQLTGDLDLQWNQELVTVACELNQIADIVFGANTNLQQLACTHNKITSLNIAKNTGLLYLYCSGNLLTKLDLSKHTKLQRLSCDENKLSSLDLSGNTKLEKVSCEDNPLLTELQLSSSVYELYAKGNTKLPAINLSNNANLSDAVQNGMPDETAETIEYMRGRNTIMVPKTTALALAVQVNSTNFPDVKFEQFVGYNYDRNNDNWLRGEELEVISINVHAKQIRNLKGIEHFVYLRELKCDSNWLTTLDLSKNINLMSLYCQENELTSLNISKNTKLGYLDCSNNKLSELDLSNNTSLNKLDCSENDDLIRLNIKNIPYLKQAREQGSQTTDSVSYKWTYTVSPTVSYWLRVPKGTIVSYKDPEIVRPEGSNSGYKGQSYSRQHVAIGSDVSSLKWTRVGGTLPPGLTLSESGLLSGTPTTANEYTYTLRVTNSTTGKYDEREFIVRIFDTLNAPRLAQRAEEFGEINVAYSSQLIAHSQSGYTDVPVTWSIVGGRLPTGLSLNPTTGVISGTPTVGGIFPFTVQVANAGGSSTWDMSITIWAPPTITTNFLPAGKEYEGYMTTLEAESPWTVHWDVLENSDSHLPYGMNFDPSGPSIRLYGEPREFGVFTLTVEARCTKDSIKWYTTTKELTLYIEPNGEAPKITTYWLDDAIIGTNYYQPLSQSSSDGGTWSLTGGQLPPGFELLSNGYVICVPTVTAPAGVYTFTVKVTNKYGSDSIEYLLLVEEPGDRLLMMNEDGEYVEFDVGKITRSRDMSRTAGQTGEPDNRGYDPDNISMTMLFPGVSTPSAALTALQGAKFERMTQNGSFETMPAVMDGNELRIGPSEKHYLSARAYDDGGVHIELTSLTSAAVRLTLNGEEYLFVTPGDVNMDGEMNALDWITIMRWTLVASGGEYTSPNDEGFTIKVNDTDYNLWVLLADMTDTETDNSKNSANWSAAVNAVDWITIMQLTLQAWK